MNSHFPFSYLTVRKKEALINNPLTLLLRKIKGLKVLSNHKPCSYFYLDNTVTIQNEKRSINLSIKHLDGNGKFSGLIRPGNRSSQVSEQSFSNLEIFDWLICLTPVYKEGIDNIEINIKIN